MIRTRKHICVCGGGNIAHAIVSAVGSQDDVTVFTRHPDKWGDRICYHIGDDPTEHYIQVDATSDATCVSTVDYIFVALPRFAISETLKKIDSSLHAGQTVIFVPSPAGMEEIVSAYTKRGIYTIGFQRVPHVARIKEYGHEVWIGQVRSVSRLAFSDDIIANDFSAYVENRFGGRVERLVSFLSFTFSNSNPLLHPSRLVALLKGGNNGVYSECPYFYAQWTDESSELYVKADDEMRQVFQHYSAESAAHDYESALSHYESTTPQEMTRKITSIESLKPILAPWKQGADGCWHPDFESRYFTEDIPYGTRIIQQYARKEGIETPAIDYLITYISDAMLRK